MPSAEENLDQAAEGNIRKGDMEYNNLVWLTIPRGDNRGDLYGVGELSENAPKR